MTYRLVLSTRVAIAEALPFPVAGDGPVSPRGRTLGDHHHGGDGRDLPVIARHAAETRRALQVRSRPAAVFSTGLSPEGQA